MTSVKVCKKTLTNAAVATRRLQAMGLCWIRLVQPHRELRRVVEDNLDLVASALVLHGQVVMRFRVEHFARLAHVPRLRFDDVVREARHQAVAVQVEFEGKTLKPVSQICSFKG
jgi:hypothetical protein